MDVAGIFHAQMRFAFGNFAALEEPSRSKNKKLLLRIIPLVVIRKSKEIRTQLSTKITESVK